MCLTSRLKVRVITLKRCDPLAWRQQLALFDKHTEAPATVTGEIRESSTKQETRDCYRSSDVNGAIIRIQRGLVQAFG